MTITLSSPTDEPYGCLHPASTRTQFSDRAAHWYSAAHYCLVQSLVLEADRKKVRETYALAEAEALATTMPRALGDETPSFEALRYALTSACEQHLPLRSVLLSTGDEPIEATLAGDAGDNRLGRALMEVRARVRVRACDPAAVQCVHQDAEEVRLACEHVLAIEARRTGVEIHRRFTGSGADHELLCASCVQALPASPPLRKLCESCFRDYVGRGRSPDVGTPEILERATSFRFSHRFVEGLPDVISFVPVARQPHTWLLLDRRGQLHRVNTEQGTREAGGRIDPAAIDLSERVVLAVAPGGELAAVGEATKRRAVVLEPATGKVTHSLVRDDYHPENCTFPLGFFELDGRLRLVHATEWNRLDVTDPRTGQLLTARELESPEAKEHALDYFHSDLLVSPGGTRVIDNGWIWHPYGQVQVFSLARWLRENVWESEDGPSVKPLAGRAYYWDGPVCWLDENTLAVWGEGEDHLELVPAAIIYDAESGAELRRFLGPAQGFASLPPYLIASDARGTEVWDPRTGERLLRDPSFCAGAVHPASRELLSLEGARLRISRLEE